MPSDFPTNCNPRIINVDQSTGCTLTRASILGMTPQTFANQGFTETLMDGVIARAQEAKVAGVTENTLEMLLMGRIADISKSSLNKMNIPGQGSVILPYHYRRQRRNINSNYWRIVSSAATPGAGTGGLHPGDWDFTVAVSNSAFASTLANIEQYFLPGGYVLIEALSAAGVAYSLQYKIIASVNAGATTAKVTLEPNYTGIGWGGLTLAQQQAFQPTVGTLICLGNSTSDYESYGQQYNAENTNKLLTFWQQTTRESHEYNDEYLKALEAALTSQFFKQFRELPLAEQKRIQHQKWMRDVMNSVFYGQRINENQTVEGYKNLPQVVDPANPSCALEYKANALGFKQQLTDCGRLLDHQGNVLNIDNLAAAGYGMKRAREATGGNVDTIDFMTNRFTAGLILQLMTSFYKAKYGITTQRFYEPDQKLVFDNQVMLNYNTYQLPPELGGYTLAIYWHPYFDDKLASFDQSIQSRGNTLWGIDWTDFTWGILGSNSANRQTNIADKLYNLVIKPVMHHYQLNSTTWTVVLDDPSRHFIVDNFSLGCPTLTVTGCSVN